MAANSIADLHIHEKKEDPATTPITQAPAGPTLHFDQQNQYTTYYAVPAGRTPGIYIDWDLAKLQVNGFKKNKYKGFRISKGGLEAAISYWNKWTATYRTNNWPTSSAEQKRLERLKSEAKSNSKATPKPKFTKAYSHPRPRGPISRAPAVGDTYLAHIRREVQKLEASGLLSNLRRIFYRRSSS